MTQQMLAIWSLAPLPFLKPAWTSGSSWFMYCWSLAWRILSITLLACEMSAIRMVHTECLWRITYSFVIYRLTLVRIFFFLTQKLERVTELNYEHVLWLLGLAREDPFLKLTFCFGGGCRKSCGWKSSWVIIEEWLLSLLYDPGEIFRSLVKISPPFCPRNASGSVVISSLQEHTHVGIFFGNDLLLCLTYWMSWGVRFWSQLIEQALLDSASEFCAEIAAWVKIPRNWCRGCGTENVFLSPCKLWGQPKGCQWRQIHRHCSN